MHHEERGSTKPAQHAFWGNTYVTSRTRTTKTYPTKISINVPPRVRNMHSITTLQSGDANNSWDRRSYKFRYLTPSYQAHRASFFLSRVTWLMFWTWPQRRPDGTITPDYHDGQQKLYMQRVFAPGFAPTSIITLCVCSIRDTFLFFCTGQE